MNNHLSYDVTAKVLSADNAIVKQIVDPDTLAAELKSATGLEFTRRAGRRIVLSPGVTNWEGREEQMRTLSAKFPNLLFTVEATNGETEVLKHYFVAGKVHVARRAGFEDFNAEKLA